MAKCPICTAPADKRCSACQGISYCSAAHQKQHWKTHKASCIPYTIKTSETYGRQLVTTRDVKKGTVIFRAEPLAVGPKRLSVPLCIKCHKGTIDRFCACPGCSLPVCKDCLDMPYEKTYHSKSECHTFGKVKVNVIDYNCYHPVYEAILPYRCLQIKEQSKEKWETLLTMAHESEARKKDGEIWTRNQVNVVDFLRKGAKVDIDEEIIHSIIGIIDVNAYEIRLPNVEVCGVYRLGGLMNHDCKPNTIYIINEDNVMIVVAATDIPKGEMISTSYADIFKGNSRRKAYLKKTKYFDCQCQRCCDPTELDSFISAVKCSSCKISYQLPVDDSCFECQSCHTVTDTVKISSLLDDISSDIAYTKPAIKEYEEILEKYNDILHENHYLLIPVVQALIKFYGRSKNYTYIELDKKLLLRKKELCRRFLFILDKLDVPMGRRRGVTIYEFCIAEYLLVKKLLEAKEIEKEEYKEKLQNVINELSECRNILNIDKLISDKVSLVDILEDNIRCIYTDMDV